MSIGIHNISVIKDNKTLLDNISCAIPSNRLIAIVGPNGAGKTTLMLECVAPSKFSTGEVKIDDTPVTELDHKQKSKLIGWVPENSHLVFSFTAEQVILMGRFPNHLGNPTSEDKLLAIKVLKDLGLEKQKDQQVTSMSSGERKKVLIGRALISDASHLFFDEPIANLDIHASFDILKNFQRYCQNKTVILSIHDLNMAYRYADYTIIMNQGKIFDAGITKDVLTPQAIEQVFKVSCEIEKNQIYFTQ